MTSATVRTIAAEVVGPERSSTTRIIGAVERSNGRLNSVTLRRGMCGGGKNVGTNSPAGGHPHASRKL
jgi:hypothetical protein